MPVHLQHCYVAFACSHLVSTYFSYSVLGGEFDYQVVGRSYGLPRVDGRSFEDGIIGGRAVDNKECNILSDFLGVITNRYGKRDYVEWVYFCPSEPNEWGVGRGHPFFVNPHLLECRVVKDVSRVFVVNQDPICVVGSYLYANDECIIMRVVETLSIFF